MPISRRTQIAASAYALSGVFILLTYLSEQGKPQSAPHSSIKATAANEVQEQTASFTLAFIKTTVVLRYDSPVRKGSTAAVTATVNQVRVLRHNPGYPISDDNIPAPQQIGSLQWPIELTLKSAAFKFDQSEENKKLSAGYKLPATIVWAPVADSEGNASLTLHFGNLNGEQSGRSQSISQRNDFVGVAINGKEKAFQLNDDIPLPITVYTVGGWPAWLWTDASAAGAVIAFIFGSAVLTGWLSRIWNWLARVPPPRPGDT